MKNLKKICCILAAAVMLVFCLPLHAYADAMPAEDAWYVGKEYQINSNGVYGYTFDYVLRGGAKEEECAFSRGDVVYVGYAVERMGITWGLCSNYRNQYEDGFELYGWTDMRYLSPVGTVYEEAPVKTEIVTELITEMPAAPATQPAATKPAAVATKIKTSVVTMKATTTAATTKKTEKAVLSEEEDSDSHSGNFFEDNFTVLLVICIIILVVSSITLAAGLINYKRKKIEQYSDATYVPDQTPRERPSVRNQADVKYCAKCGAKNPVQAVFCSKCGTHFYPVNGKNQ